ncbi:guanylate kinase [Methylocystis sp. JAN1]|uniref:guanylate kinase n=1 Tax=Methylocystis sp. JAN1 TaxID=3397211 RepID=UPI003FA248D8
MDLSLPLRRGVVLILSSPSGAGKTTLTRMLLQDRDLDLTLSISVTTRARRSSEVDGIHYRFINERQFAAMRDGSELLEWAEVHGNFYGTPRAPVEAILAQGRDCLFDIDYQGTRQVREKMGADTVTVFILPPSMRELRARLERRAEDARDVIERRLENARKEIARWKDYDYVIVNDDLQRSFDDLIAILRAERQRRPRREREIDGFVAKLLSE